MPGPADRFEEEDEFEGLSTGDYLQSAFGGALSGAAAGSAFGPWGALAGGLGGLGVGWADSASQQRQLEAAFAQQQELNRELAEAGLDAETFAQNAALQGGMAAERAEAEANFAGRRAGLSPAQIIALQQQGRIDAQLAGVQAQAPLLQAAQQARSQRQQDILNQYQVAQMLQDNAMTPGLSESFGSAMQAASALGTLRGQPDAAAAKINPGAEDVSKLSTAFAESPVTQEELIRPYIRPIVPQSQPVVQTPVSAPQASQSFQGTGSPWGLPAATGAAPVPAMPAIRLGGRTAVAGAPAQTYALGSQYDDWLLGQRFDASGQATTPPTAGFEGSSWAELANEAARPTVAVPSPVGLAAEVRQPLNVEIPAGEPLATQVSPAAWRVDENSALGRVFSTLDEGGTLEDLDLQGTGMDPTQVQTIKRIYLSLQRSTPGTSTYTSAVDELIEIAGGTQ
ncbi:MAG: hypothetical protein CL484_12055 [Acidobacteria bacterium]|nr:hypothetical protein [Acidobacteriota bacterium]|tara:strand:- start:683 stop:2044 length:1362 start_codon:yes stop_codon:yes gene_type:complete